MDAIALAYAIVAVLYGVCAVTIGYWWGRVDGNADARADIDSLTNQLYHADRNLVDNFIADAERTDTAS